MKTVLPSARILPPASSNQIVPLHLLQPGETGCVCDVSGEDTLIARLDEMGLRTGAHVRMVQPGQPCIVALDNQRLSLRAADDTLVLVEVCRES